jgi:hypothetical protein
LRTLTAFAAALILAAPALAQISPNPFNDQMRKLSPADRAGALRRAVTMENQRCGRMSTGFYRGMYGNLAYWQARCQPGGDYGVFVGPGGEVQVRRCDEMKALKLPECRPFGK